MPTTDAQMGFGVPTNLAPAGQRAVMATKGFLPWSSSLGSGMIQPSLLLVGSSLLPSQLSRSCGPWCLCSALAATANMHRSTEKSHAPKAH